MQTNCGFNPPKLEEGGVIDSAKRLPQAVQDILLAQPLNPLVRLAFSTADRGLQARSAGETSNAPAMSPV